MSNFRSLDEKENYLKNLYSKTLSTEFLELIQFARNKSVEIQKATISLGFSEAFSMAQMIRFHKLDVMVELGSLTGYSALFILLGLKENGKIFCFEKDQKWADILKQTLSQIKNVPELKSKSFEIVVGDAAEQLLNFNFGVKIDGVFIDANKAAYLNYLHWAEKNVQKNGLVIADNVFLRGQVWEKTESPFSDKQIQVMKDFNESIVQSGHFDSFILNSSDGMMIAIKKA